PARRGRLRGAGRADREPVHRLRLRRRRLPALLRRGDEPDGGGGVERARAAGDGRRADVGRRGDRSEARDRGQWRGPAPRRTLGDAGRALPGPRPGAASHRGDLLVRRREPGLPASHAARRDRPRGCADGALPRDRVQRALVVAAPDRALRDHPGVVTASESLALALRLLAERPDFPGALVDRGSLARIERELAQLPPVSCAAGFEVRLGAGAATVDFATLIAGRSPGVAALAQL